MSETNFVPAIPGDDGLGEFIDEVASVRLSFISVANGMSKTVTEGKARPGDVTTGGESLGKRVLCVVGPRRPHAIYFNDGEKVIESFDRSSDEWQEVKRGAAAGEDGYAIGIQHLLYLVRERKFAVVTFSKSGFDNAKGAWERRSKLAVLTAQKIKGKKHTWFVPKVEDTKDGEADGVDIVCKEGPYNTAVDLFTAPLRETAATVEGRPR